LIKVQKNDFNLNKEINTITTQNNNIGGIASFVGLVRGGKNNTLKSMTLEHYPGMTEKMLKKIESEAHNRWELKDSLIIHRYGKLLPGEQIVLVATASEHRNNAIESCEFLIDWLKTKAPFWKLEDTISGKKWVSERNSDLEATTKWNN